MGTNNLDCSVSFEIPIRDEVQSPRALRLLSSPNYIRNDSDLNERLEKARERRSNVLAIEKAKQLADARASPQSILLRQINDDMSNKENNRRSHLQNIVHQCQLEVDP
ncbi:unnamed protein product [Schistosoma margrebowiei]|uniref:Uncharacterized protein n=1 Tax=Schistosoma margrebowiei TaxID=48269 RepID=A0A183LSB2_9TREM|nr:unnamed protein product [Schistosoma margrebowiei]